MVDCHHVTWYRGTPLAGSPEGTTIVQVSVEESGDPCLRSDPHNGLEPPVAQILTCKGIRRDPSHHLKGSPLCEVFIMIFGRQRCVSLC